MKPEAVRKADHLLDALSAKNRQVATLRDSMADLEREIETATGEQAEIIRQLKAHGVEADGTWSNDRIVA